MTRIDWNTMRPGLAAMFLVNAKRQLSPIPALEALARERLVFVHVPKNGGTSIAQIFFGLRNAPGHYKWWFYRYYFGAHTFERTFKFAFCRNPFGRLVSAWSYLLSGGNSMRDREFSLEHLSASESFPEFVERLARERALREWVHFQPQHPFVYDQREVLRVDYLARFEHFAQEVETLGARLGRCVRHRHAKMGIQQGLESFYESDRTRNLIVSLYAKDFELLGYDTCV